MQDEHAAWRQWLDDQLAFLPDQASEALAMRVWLDEHFWPVNFELAAGAGLRAAGLRTGYEEVRDGLSPDWTVLSDSGTPLAFVEVHTDMPARRPSGRCEHGTAWWNASKKSPSLSIAARIGPTR